MDDHVLKQNAFEGWNNANTILDSLITICTKPFSLFKESNHINVCESSEFKMLEKIVEDENKTPSIFIFADRLGI